jgi:hypothetical protein
MLWLQHEFFIKAHFADWCNIFLQKKNYIHLHQYILIEFYIFDDLSSSPEIICCPLIIYSYLLKYFAAISIRCISSPEIIGNIMIKIKSATTKI